MSSSSQTPPRNKRRKVVKYKMKTYKEEISFKKSPQQAGPLNLRDVSSSFKVDEKKLVKEIKSVCKSLAPGSSSSSSSVDMKSMKSDDNNIARVIPGRITSVKFLPTKDMRMLVAGNMFGNVSFWRIDESDDDDDNNNGIYVYYPHSGLVSGISIHPFSLSRIITSCYNGFIRMLDVEKERYDLVYTSLTLDPIFSICRQNENSLFFGESYGGVGSLDLRTSKPSTPWNLHSGKICTIDFNSHNTNLMATSSKDKTACIWDLRKMNDLPLKRVQHKNVVNSAYFSPSGSLLATTSSDDKIGVISGSNYDVESMISHRNSVSRFISSIRGIWGWDDSSIFVANSFSKMKGVDILSVDNKKISYTLGSRHLTAIPCRLDAHPMMPGVLAGSTAKGCICVWDI